MTTTGVICTKQDADEAAHAEAEGFWNEWREEQDMPDDWEEAMSQLADDGCDADIVIEEHDISHHPDLIAAKK